jgi:hypothetical protein
MDSTSLSGSSTGRSGRGQSSSSTVSDIPQKIKETYNEYAPESLKTYNIPSMGQVKDKIQDSPLWREPRRPHEREKVGKVGMTIVLIGTSVALAGTLLALTGASFAVAKLGWGKVKGFYDRGYGGDDSYGSSYGSYGDRYGDRYGSSSSSSRCYD